MSLPITVILPTRNVRAVIESHLDAILPWIGGVAQVVVVDSSDDGTLDFLREKLAAFPRAEFHARPPGLYESWNFAVQRASADFVYFSTVGDGIDEPGLRHLLEVAGGTGADIVLSPPQMITETGAPDARRWPIHRLCDELHGAGPVLLDSAEAFALSVSAIPETILGSSASNLYRRDFLAGRPFPEAWGHRADSAWMIMNAVQARIAVTGKCVARFVVHEQAPGSEPASDLEAFERMAQLSAPAVRTSGLPESSREVFAAWSLILHARHRQHLKRIALRESQLERLEQRLENTRLAAEKMEAGLRTRNANLEAAWKKERAEAESFRGKVIGLREEKAAYERRHGKLFAILGLYLSAKARQASRLFQFIRGGRKADASKP